MDTLAAIIILTPILLPIVLNLGYDPIHFGILMVVNLAIVLGGLNWLDTRRSVAVLTPFYILALLNVIVDFRYRMLAFRGQRFSLLRSQSSLRGSSAVAFPAGVSHLPLQSTVLKINIEL
jgi:hypothetical protein